MKEYFKIALSQYGIKEIPGDKDNPEIIKYFTQVGFLESSIKDETAWCSAFANWVMDKAGKERSGALNARSWLSVGYKIETPELGDIVVLWRESRDSWKGHVGFFVNKIGDQIYLLGGNQNNQVCIAAYNEIQLLECRRI